MTAKEILASDKILYMNSPEGYPFAEKINQHELGRLKGFLINTAGGDEALSQVIRETEHEEIIQNLLDSNFTFDEDWFGARLLDWQKG